MLFPEFSQVAARPCRATAIALLKLYPGAQAVATTGVETIAAKLHELAPRNYGRKTAEQLVSLAQHSGSSGVATSARSISLKILFDQLEHTQANLAQLQAEIDKLLDADTGAKGLQSVPEFGPKTVAVLRAELGDVQRFERTDLRGGLCRLGSGGQAEWQMERANQAFQARQWPASPHLVHGGGALYPAQRLRLWSLLPSLSRSRHERG